MEVEKLRSCVETRPRRVSKQLIILNYRQSKTPQILVLADLHLRKLH